MRDLSVLLDDLPPFIYGTTRLGHDDRPREQRVAMARLAMDAVDWFHTSRQYDDALEVLAEAFADAGRRGPKLIAKIGSDSVDGVRRVIADNLGPLGRDHLEIGQLSFAGELAEGMRDGSALDGLRAIRDEGLVGRFIWEVFPWTSDLPAEVLASGRADDLVDGVIFYLNPLQRFVTNPLWDQLLAQGRALISMRTVAGGPVHRLRDEPGFAWKDYLRQRAGEIAPLFEASGVAGWTAFSASFSLGLPGVKATVGSTADPDHLGELLAATAAPVTLPDSTVAAVLHQQRRWSDETDRGAEPWTM